MHEYLIAHPEVLQEAMAELRSARPRPKPKSTRPRSRSNASALFSSPHQVMLGNPKGNVTFVEFFDYNCGYCKRAMTDMLDADEGRPQAQGRAQGIPGARPGSVEAAHVAVAVRMQDKTGKKYLEFHQKLLGGRGQADKARALAVAKEVGMDMARIEQGHGERRGRRRP